ncbi:MAG: hypothetical protein EA377_00825 [Phycisphaerales bacterium]|nr:MAG: hypothetical protein EA377_00825 [Phycisphaerales bacterium]
MKTFTDTTGRNWTITVNVDAIKRVRSLCDVDLLEWSDGKLIERLIRDPILLCDVVYAVCKPQIDERSITDEDFGQAMAGDAIEHATTALLEEVVNFSPNLRDRQLAERVMKRTWQAMDRARDVIETRIDQELDRITDEALEELEKELTGEGLPGAGAGDGGSSGSLPASSDSTPAHSP